MKSRLAFAILFLGSIAASSQTVSVNYRVFPGGEFLPPFSIFHTTPGGDTILGAPKQIQIQDPNSPGNLLTYSFLFWLVPSSPPSAPNSGPINNGLFGPDLYEPGGPTSSTEAFFKLPPSTTHTSAWYQLVEPSVCSNKPCITQSYAGAFSEDDGQLISGTP